MDFELVGELTAIETIAVNLSIRERKSLKAHYGGRRWRKLKGIGLVRLLNGSVYNAEVHWYEAHGVGRRKMKIKRFLDQDTMAKKHRQPKFAICVANEGCDDLQVWKLYRVLPDAAATAEGYLRVVDDSGEDYLYAA